MELQYLIPNSFPVFFASLLFLFVVLKLALSTTYKQRPNLPPGPRKLPLIGNMLQVGSLPHRGLRDLAKKHGPLMHLQLGEVSTVVVSSAEIAREVMKSHDTNFATRPFLLAPHILSYKSTDIAFAPYGEYWRQLRKICVWELLSAKRVQSFRSIREEEVSNLIKTISTSVGSPINLSKQISLMTGSILMRTSIGTKCEEQETLVKLIGEIIALAGGFHVGDHFPSSKIIGLITGLEPKLVRIHHEVDRLFDNIIDEHRAKKSTGRGGEAEAEAVEDLVDVLLRVGENGDLQLPLTADNIKAVVLDMFVAGTDTTFTAIDWTLSEMVKNPRTMEKAQAEVRRVFKEKGDVEETGLHELTYLKAVIKETLRLHPPLPLLLPRECRETCEINGYVIPAKTKVVVNAWAIGRNPEHWTDAESFVPERFLDNPTDFKGVHFEYTPFGAGRRMCPGMIFGLASVELPLAHLLYHFDWKLADGTKNEDLDMIDIFGLSVRRKEDLHLIAEASRPN